MARCLSRAALPGLALGLALASTPASAAAPELPAGSRTTWVVEGPEEIVQYLVFDPVGVRDRLPRELRFVSVGELATGGVAWARELLASHPGKGSWGVSFLELVRARTFTIDGRSPEWPRDGAAALWLARVAPADPAADLGFGRPFLALELWMPDRAYAAFMREKGHHATFGEATLRPGADGAWTGSLAAPGLRVSAACAPSGPESGGPGSAGSQAISPPASSLVTDVVRVSFAGHRERECAAAPAWRIERSHPLSKAVPAGPASFQHGYSLRGGAFPR